MLKVRFALPMILFLAVFAGSLAASTAVAATNHPGLGIWCNGTSIPGAQLVRFYDDGGYHRHEWQYTDPPFNYIQKIC